MMKKMLIALAAILIEASASAQKLGLRPKLTQKGSFSMIVIPDPQCYVKFKANQPLLDLLTS